MDRATTFYDFKVKGADGRERLLSDDEFVAVGDWLENQGCFVCRQRRRVAHGNGDIVSAAPLRKSDISVGNPGDELNEVKGTAHWWREHKARTNRFGDPDWCILRIDFGDMPNLRLYRNDPWSQTGLVLKTEIPRDRIEQIA